MDQDGTIVIDRHLYLTEDRTRVVEEGDPASRFLWAAPGDEVSRAEAVRLGAVKAEPERAKEAPEAEAESEPKQRAQRANKARRPSGDKGVGAA
ncbi:hypothetical protein QMZ92_16355 [Streptomyces sp. HNM0645]|uniref:hypothetical protein n=1 Tax=Streptomyces sp. HNM0645 TaxID=2782343 RepID=UPI0024B7D1EE|nr:hypothetical protein [Streptomyces sp. HNM0645]MDI9885907.1 hypothetical protein [Streptomyces sp. HNM0645]